MSRNKHINYGCFGWKNYLHSQCLMQRYFEGWLGIDRFTAAKREYETDEVNGLCTVLMKGD